MKLVRSVTRTDQVELNAACASCAYFQIAGPQASGGYCHRRAPTSGWPQVSATDWCGEYDQMK